MIRNLEPNEAVETLPFIKKRAAEPIRKVLLTAIANAKVKGVADESKLKIKEIQIDEGPRLKRGRPVSRGRWHPYQKKMSHIRIVLETKEKVVSSVKAEKVSKQEKSATKSIKSVKSEAEVKTASDLKAKLVSRKTDEGKRKRSFGERAKSIMRTRTTNK